MKKIILILPIICLTAIGYAQNEDTLTINKTVPLDSLTYSSLKQKPTATPSVKPILSFTADEFINNLMSIFTYWAPFYKNHPTTLYIFPNPKSSSDSILVAENSDNKYVFKKVGNEWFVTNFSITVSQFTLNHVECGQTSKEALKKMGIKIEKPITDGQVWVSNNSGTFKFLLTFAHDKLTRIQL